jgi:ubiquinone/menaquinone biosynthesis C-methylase UbiE
VTASGDGTTATAGAVAVAGFYGRYAALYDAIATLPGVARWRAAAADSLALSPGDHVVEMGCGSGANLPHLADRVGPEGHVLGVDLTPELLAVARDRTANLPQVSLARGDATHPPVATGDVDAVLGTFVTGMFRDPAAVVAAWCHLVGGDGRIALMDLSASGHPVGRLLNPPFRAFTAASAPAAGPADVLRGFLPGAAAEDVLATRVDAGREALVARTRDRTFETFALGFCGLLSGRVAGE